jgi:hypothetical protein
MHAVPVSRFTRLQESQADTSNDDLHSDFNARRSRWVGRKDALRAGNWARHRIPCAAPAIDGLKTCA